MFADVAPQLLALLRREPARAAFLLMALLPAVLELLAARLALLLEALEAALTVAGLGLSRENGGQRQKGTRQGSKTFHGSLSAKGVSRCGRSTQLGVVLLIVNVPARPVKVMLQVGAFGPGEDTVRLVQALFLADVALLARQAVRLAARQFAGAHALADALLLMVLARIDAGVVRTRLCRSGKPEGGHAGQKHADKQREHWRQQRARLLYVIGRTSEYASLWADAYRAYRGSESLKPSDAMRNAIRKRIQALLSHIPATLTLHTEPEQAEIELIDAQGRVHQGKSPLKLTLPPGSTTFSIQQKGYETRKRRLSLDPLQHTQLFLELLPLQTAQQSNAPPSTSWRVPVAWASVGMGLASSIASIALIAVSQQQLAAYDAQRASPKATAQFALDPERFVDPLRSAQSTEAASIGTFAGACVFFGLAAALLFWSPPKPPSTAALPSPTSFLPAPSTSPIVATSPPLPQRLYRIP